MRAYRLYIFGVVLFSIAYPLVSGSVLVMQWDGGVGEIYPFAPWTLFCFVPNQEVDFAVRIRAVDGRPLDPPPFFEEFATNAESQMTVGYAIVQEMGRFAEDASSAAFRKQRGLFERTFLQPVAKKVEYEIVRREFDVLERWQSRRFKKIELLGELVYEAHAEGI
ncbi:MAG: hypothetical protein WD669_02440 [Pirellulales bacterium]